MRKHWKGISSGKRAVIPGRMRVILFYPYSMSFLQMRKPRLREVKEHFQDHTAAKEQRLDLNMGLRGSKTTYVPHRGPSFSQGRMDGNSGSSRIALISTSFFVL